MNGFVQDIESLAVHNDDCCQMLCMAQNCPLVVHCPAIKDLEEAEQSEPNAS
jgi:hypothetical protein